nr:hypothetical protein [Tanacetum cinerariifolium]
MLVDALLQHEVEGRVDRLLEKVEGLESKQVKLVDELVIKVVEVTERIEVLMKSLTSLQSSLSKCNGRNGCSYKDFVAYKPKEFDDNQKVKYSAGSLTSRALTWWNSEVGTRGREAAVGMTWEDFKALMKEEYFPSNKIQRLIPYLVTPETKRIKRNVSLKWNGGESSKEGNVKNENKRSRNGKVFVTITNPVKKEYTGSAPKWTNCNFHHILETHYCMCTNCNCLGHFARDCRAGHRMVNPLNARIPTAARRACYECGRTDHYKSTCLRLNRALGQGGNHPNKAMAIEGGLSPPSSGMRVVSTYTTLMMESKKCSFFCHLLKSTPSNLLSLSKFEAMCFIAAAIDYHKIVYFECWILCVPDQGSKERPPRLATGRYAQCAYFDAKAEAIHLILTGIGDDIYSTVDACTTAKEMWTTIERLQQAEAIHLILTGIGDDIYSTVDACTTAKEMWTTIERLQQGTMTGVDINTFTMKQYLALSRENQARGVVKPKIEGNVNFEIKSQFIRELKEDTLSGNKNEDAHDHVDRVSTL